MNALVLWTLVEIAQNNNMLSSFDETLCNVLNLNPLSIGTVLFEPRNTWLDRMSSNGIVSKISLSRIKRAWKVERLRKRKESMNQIREGEILDTIGKCDYVCSVNVETAGDEAWLQKALTAARLATTAIALAWKRP